MLTIILLAECIYQSYDEVENQTVLKCQLNEFFVTKRHSGWSEENSRSLSDWRMEFMKNHFNCDYPCDDILKEIIYPDIELEPENITTVIISECPTKNESDYFYKSETGSFFENTRMIFDDAGITVNNYNDLLSWGVYLSTALKCRKLDYLVSANTVKECSLRFLKRELEQFPNEKVILCMGDYAIKAVNHIYKETFNTRVIEAGSTYKIRNHEHISHGIRFFPSYTHTGGSFNIEKSKRQMIVEDIKNAFSFLGKKLV